MQIETRLISAAEARTVRAPILRAGFPPESAIFDGDDAHETTHFGAFFGGELAGVVSIYRVPFPGEDGHDDWQLRGMAVTAERQRQGVGEVLLKTCLASVRGASGKRIWCNARTPAVPFYVKNGWKVVGEEFEIPTAGPHFRMWISVI